MPTIRIPTIRCIVCAACFLAACQAASVPPPILSPVPPTRLPTAERATPIADTPASPCDTWGTDVVTFTINPDTTMPRCLKVTAQEQLQVINRTSTTVEIKLAHFDVQVASGATYTFAEPIGSYLAPGVHGVWMSCYAGYGPEIWLT